MLSRDFFKQLQVIRSFVPSVRDAFNNLSEASLTREWLNTARNILL